MILSDKIINELKKKSGLLFDKANDFETLSAMIFKVTGRSIGVTTLKRLFNYIQDDRNANSYTLNTIAQYLGYETWDLYMSAKDIDSEWKFRDKSVYVSELGIGDEVSVKYLNRVVSFEVTEHEGRKVLKVISAENSSLEIGDILFVYRIRKGDILEAEKVIRKKSIGNYKTHGEIKSVEVKKK